MTHDEAVLKAREIVSRVLSPSAGQNDKAGPHSCGDFGPPVIRVAVNNDDLRREVGRDIREYTLNRQRFIMGRDD